VVRHVAAGHRVRWALVPPSLVRSPAHPLAQRVRCLVHEIAKFGVVGTVAFVIDIGGFILLRYGLDGHGVLHDMPLTARTISIVLATTVAYFGNRHWTWRHGERRARRVEYTLFFLLNLAGLAVNLAVLGATIYLLDLRGPLATTVANLVGIGMGTLLRFWSYRRFVFRVTSRAPAPREDLARASTPV
jgi:putative flippase GtrA